MKKPAATADATKAAAVNVGNKICPVSGMNVNSMSPVTYEYEGKIYNFCCAGCIDEFKKDPKKYIQKIEAELKNPAEQKK
ncbi:MAG: YHS domain-containing protein [Candidatus Omnitrophica bacterium]|nr:YHS domain-containing protein [Candidatus Omnitrophota bacterium]